jgi:hypothetical protein
VAFGQHDAPSILPACPEVLRRPDAPRLLFKLHPRSGFRRVEVDRFMVQKGLCGGYDVAEGTVYDLLPMVDAVVGTYSSVVMEAAALGIPAVCLHVADRVNTSPILDLEAVPSLVAAPPRRLAEALAEALQAGTGRAAPGAWCYFFGPEDKPAEAMWVEAIARDGAPRSPTQGAS